MFRWIILALELLIMAGIFRLCDRVIWKRFSKAFRTAAAIVGICAVFIAFSGAQLVEIPTRTVVITALDEKNEKSENTQIYLREIRLDGERVSIPEPLEGKWSWYNDFYCWFDEDDHDERMQEGTTAAITLELPLAEKTEFIFSSNRWKGLVSIKTDAVEKVLDTYCDSEGSEKAGITLPPSDLAQSAQLIFRPVFGFTVTLIPLILLLTGLVFFGTRAVSVVFERLSGYGPIARLLNNQFLFEELVARDFKKKYKRTVLGMIWSVLSPLLTLLIMRIVFTQFFGRNMDHYTTYLFCGNLVFSYFSESTGQGMQALVSNACIFTKVNVPKYLFLFSKNVQTLINFGLTLGVFCVFCAIDKITFTWKFVLLLYPICCLLLFNIGVGLILSALYVFFQDIQYLWSVFTQLLMYLSAIFYTIDQYDETIQYLFLLNPVYLFIRYFRKIVMDSVIPTPQFHFLMAADVAVVLGIGCWMYRKYNSKFLYYV